MLLFCKVLEIGVTILRCQDIDTLVLLRKDHKKNEVLKIFGAMTIIRFIHASEYSPYHIYPLYPVERARVDGTIDILLTKHSQYNSSDLLKLIEQTLLEHPYISITAPIRNKVDIQLKGEDPDPTIADIIAYYLVKDHSAEAKSNDLKKLNAWT